MEVIEPRRVAQQAAHAKRTQEGHQAIGGESHGHLVRWHRHVQLSEHVSRECSGNKQPPASVRSKHEEAKKYDVRRPEWSKDPVGKGAEVERPYGPQIVGNTQEQRFSQSRINGAPPGLGFTRSLEVLRQPREKVGQGHVESVCHIPELQSGNSIFAGLVVPQLLRPQSQAICQTLKRTATIDATLPDAGPDMCVHMTSFRVGGICHWQ